MYTVIPFSWWLQVTSYHFLVPFHHFPGSCTNPVPSNYQTLAVGHFCSQQKVQVLFYHISHPLFSDSAQSLRGKNAAGGTYPDVPWLVYSSHWLSLGGIPGASRYLPQGQDHSEPLPTQEVLGPLFP